MTDPEPEPTPDPPPHATSDPAATAAADDELLAQLADDFSGRLRRGERPTVQEYVAAHPELGERLRKMFAAIAAIEESRPIDSLFPSEQPGNLVGRYKLLERIGEGGFGIVFMAEQQFPVRRRVALKLIKAGLDTRQVIARFEAERQALAMMNHEHIARVLDAGATETGRPYFVMELVHGVPITTYCDANRLSPRQRLELFVLVCRAIQHAHTKGIIHRDIKPTNVLVTVRDGVAVPKVIDFGVAKATGQQPLTERTLFTQFAQMVGTPLYMSPEQAEMSAPDIDTRSDVYSLGVLLYELLTGTTPFDVDRMRKAAHDEVRRIIREEEPPAPSTRISTLGTRSAAISGQRKTDARRLRQVVRGDLDWIVMKCLEKDRSRRYETPNALALDIQRHFDNEPIAARRPGAVYRLRKLARRNRAAVLTALLLVAVMVAATVVSAWQAVRATTAEQESRRVAAELALDKGQLLGESGDTDLAVLWLARSLTLAPPDAGPLQATIRRSISAWQVEVNRARKALPHDGAVFALAYAPDGHVLTISWKPGAPTGSLRRWDPGSGASDTTPQMFAGSLSETTPTFSDDARHLLLGFMDGKVQLIEVATGRVVWEYREEGAYPTKAAFSPDGRMVLVGYAVGSAQALRQTGRSRLFDAAAGTVIGPTIQHDNPVYAAAFHPDGKSFVTECGLWLDAAEKSEARFWDVDGRPSREPLAHPCMASAVAFSPDGTKLLTGHPDFKARLWDLTGVQEPVEMQHDGPIVAAGFSRDGEAFVTGAYDGSARVWDATGRLIVPPLRRFHMVEAAAFNATGTSLLVGIRGNMAWVWDLAAGSRARSAGSGTRELLPLAISVDRRTTLTRDASYNVSLRDVDTGQPLGPPLPHDRPVLIGGTSVPPSQRQACASDRRRALTLDAANVARLWNAQTGKLISVLKSDPESTFFAAGFSPDGATVVTGNFACTAQLWDATTGALRREVKHEADGPVFNICFTPDGKLLVTGGADKAVRFWNPRTGEPVGAPLIHTAAPFAVAVGPDGRLVLTGDMDRDVQLWDLASRRRVLRLTGHHGGINDAAFSPDGTLAVTGSRDRTARLWDVATGKQIGPPLHHDGPVLRVVFSRDGTTVHTATADQTMHTWQIRPPAEGTAERLELWAQVVTAMELEGDGGVHILDAATWQNRQNKLTSDAAPRPPASTYPSR